MLEVHSFSNGKQPNQQTLVLRELLEQRISKTNIDKDEPKEYCVNTEKKARQKL
jgi:hypothetical protein